MTTAIFLLIILSSHLGFISCQDKYFFNKNFKFGVSTSAYQIEGAWNEDGKSRNNWDDLTHNNPEFIADHSTGDDACKSYKLYKRDVQMLDEIKANFYKFSISWSRILPYGWKTKISESGVEYYKKLLDELEANKIEPYVTMFQWDLPQSLVTIGGFNNRKLVDVFTDYAKILFGMFGDRVKNWITFNDPAGYCHMFNEFENASTPVHITGISEYLCGHNILLAHKNVYRLYEKDFKSEQNGLISIALSSPWYEPASPNDNTTQDRIFDFKLGWLAHNIFTQEGDYPSMMKERIEEISKKHNFERSRLPAFTDEEIEDMKHTADFFAINYYGAYMVKSSPESDYIGEWPTIYQDIGVEIEGNTNWPTTDDERIHVYPEGLRKLLKYINDKYAVEDIRVLENGYPSHNPHQNDTERVKYIRDHVTEIGKAINDDEVKVTAYCVWSLMDNFAWTKGYTLQYGLFGVDFHRDNKTRYPRASAMAFRHIVTNRIVNYDFIPIIVEPTPTVCTSVVIDSSATKKYIYFILHLITMSVLYLLTA